MDFSLTVLGTASAMPVVERNQSAQVLNVHGRLFLIDCGEGVQKELLRNHIPLMKIDSVFISHIHGDHVFGFPGLMCTLGMLKRTMPLNVYAPENFGPFLKFILSYYGEGISFEIRYFPLKMKTIETIYETRSVRVEAFPLNHKIETFGFRFSEKEPQLNVRKDAIEEYGLTLTEIGSLKRGEDVVRDGGSTVLKCGDLTYRPYVPRSFAYCSDTAPFPELPSRVRGVDLLYHESTYLEDMGDEVRKWFHCTAAQAAACAREAGVKRLLLGHYSSRCRDAQRYLDEAKAIFPDTCAASDGDVFTVPLERSEYGKYGK